MSIYEEKNTDLQDLIKKNWKILVGSFGVLALISGIFVVVNNAVPPKIDLPNWTFVEGFIRPHTPIFGNKEANIKVVYLFDFQCSACASNYPEFKQITDDSLYQSKVAFAYKMFPIESIHPFAIAAAKAATAGHEQGKFKDFYDIFYTNQKEINLRKIEEWAKNMPNLDYAKWEIAYKSSKVADEVKSDLKDIDFAIMPSIDGKTKIASTPTTVIYKDNKIIDWFSGVKPASELKAKLDKILAE
jgi:protein-disulfide isomerase